MKKRYMVYLNGKWIDAVSQTFNKKEGNKAYREEYVRRSLINHDGYDPGIVVRERNTPSKNPAYKKSWGGYRGQLHENPAANYSENKLKSEHRKAAKKYRLTFGNFGWVMDETGMTSKTNRGYLTTDYIDGKYVHKFEPYENPARGFKTTKVETAGGVTYEWLQNFLSKKDARRLAANTDAIRQSSGSIAIQLYQTKILIFKANGEIELRLGGWNTATTRNRINALLPYGWKIFTKKGIPYVSNSYKSVEVPPTDSIVLNQTGAYV